MDATSLILPSPKSLRHDGVLMFASGFLATLAMTTIMYVLVIVGLAQVDLPLWAARLFVTGAVPAVALGLALHLVLGFSYAWVFASQVEPRLRLGAAQAGLLFGAALWLLEQAFAVPALGALGGAHRSPTPRRSDVEPRIDRRQIADNKPLDQPQRCQKEQTL